MPPTFAAPEPSGNPWAYGEDDQTANVSRHFFVTRSADITARMFGWINDCTECLVVSKFGEDTWHQIKEKANCTVEDGGFLRYQYYPDSDTVELVVAASEVLGISVDDVLHAFGDYFIDYVSDNGYSNILECLGSNLRDWLSNLNSLHDHLQASYPKGFVAPVFWSEDDEDFETSTVGAESNAILVHYFSHRGSLLVPLVVGLIKKLARVYFDIEITMTQLQLQDEEKGVKHTSWRITTIDPEESFKLRGKKKRPKKKTSSSEDDETVLSTITSRTNYEATFIGGREQASNLRVEELIKRSFHNQNRELYYSLTSEHYRYLVSYWQETKIDGKWCYQIWSMQDDNPESWATLADLPPKLNAKTIDPTQFGGKVPETGKFPPQQNLELQSFPPFVRLTNSETGASVDIETTKSTETTLDQAIYKADLVEKSGVNTFPGREDQLEAGSFEIQYVVWDEDLDAPYHTFLLGDLASTSTKQLFDMLPKTFDPIKVVVQCVESIVVDEDEEDI